MVTTDDLVCGVFASVLGRWPTHNDLAAWTGLPRNAEGVAGLVDATLRSAEAETAWWRSPALRHVVASVLLSAPVEQDRPQLFFQHIPKTAGISVSDVVTRSLPPFSSISMSAIDNLLILPSGVLERLAFVSSHVGAGGNGLLTRPIHSMVVIRNPVDRAYSHYRHAVRSPGWPAHAEVRAMPFEEYLDDPRFAPYWSDYQARYLTAQLPPELLDSVAAKARVERHLRTSDLGESAAVQAAFDLMGWETSVDQAMAALERMDLVLATERLDFAGPAITRWAGLAGVRAAEAEISQLNEAPGEGAPTLSDSVRRRVEEANSIDMALWERATIRSGG